MKKLAIGCGVVLLVTGVIAAGAAYYLYRQVSSTIAQFEQLAQVPEIERSVRNRTPFEPPASEELTDGQIEKLLQVQAAVRRRVGQRMAAFEANYEALSKKGEASVSDAPAIIRAYGDLAATWLDAKRSQVEALNAAGLSLEEYRWIRDQAYRAVGMPFVDLDFGRLAEEAKRGIRPDGIGELRGALEPAGPASNRTRLQKVRKQLEENLALASFGL